MKKFYNVIFVLAIPALFLILTSESDKLNGSPGGKTGSPGDGGANCTGCHAGTPVTEEFWINSSELMTTGYQSGQEYDIVVVGVDAAAGKFGFEATAESSTGAKVGTFVPGPLELNKLCNNNKAVTHTLAGTVPLVPGEGTSWFFKWTAPETSTGAITFYAAINAANGNGANTGDQIHLSSFVASPAVGISENSVEQSFQVYPNPSTGLVNIKSNENLNKIEVLNLHGQLVYSQDAGEQNTKLDLTDLHKGIYFIRSGKHTQRLIIH
jgi:hypothetical protein